MALLLSACNQPWNNPYPSSDAKANYYYSSFTEQPKTLDPARSYSMNEAVFNSQVYQAPLQYDYLKRPYQLMPLTAVKLPEISADKDFTYYKIQIRPGIYYQPHPAFACKLYNAKGECIDYLYHHLNPSEIKSKKTLQDFPVSGTRELTAEDYVYEIKRLASPKVQSPIFGFLSQYIVGFNEFNQLLAKQSQPMSFLDLRQFPLAGVQLLDKYTYVIKIKGHYPQFIYWLSMPFFSPVPWEADVFYNQPGMQANNLGFDWNPIGTGPYILTENNPNLRMVLSRNPNFRPENDPGLVAYGNYLKLNQKMPKQLPAMDKFIYTLEKESIPRWNKFLQGYYDMSAITSDSFDQAIKVDQQGQPMVTPLLQQKKIQLQTSIPPEIHYTGFNMLDPVVGGYSDRAKKLRQAIAIAFNTEEYIAIFLNGRGLPAQTPIPPEIFGYQKDVVNSVIYQKVNGSLKRRSLEDAKKLLAEAGYVNGRDPVTRQPLLLNFDIMSGGTGDDRSYFSWLREQFAKLGIDLQIRDTQYNRFQEKVRNGQAQIFSWAWIADYPDPENFLFLLYGPSGKVKFGGENAANYLNPEFDRLFTEMKLLPNGPERQQLIDKMVRIVQEDSPWIGTYYSRSFLLINSWMYGVMPSDLIHNSLKYWQLDPIQRDQSRVLWNQPIFWPILVFVLVLILGLLPIFIWYWRRQHRSYRENV